MKINKAIASLIVTGGFVASCLGSAVDAHGIWVADRLDEKHIVLGEGAKDNAYAPNNVQAVQGYTVDWHTTAAQIIDQGNHVAIKPADNAAVVGVQFDYGYWSKDKNGKYHHVPMNQVPNAVLGTHAIKYNVTYLQAGTHVQALPSIPLQIVPQLDPMTLHKGDSLPVLVLKEGKPLAGAEIIPDVVNDLNHTVVTDQNGRATITIANQALNVIGLEIAFPVTDHDGMATQNKYFTSLSFTLSPDYD